MKKLLSLITLLSFAGCDYAPASILTDALAQVESGNGATSSNIYQMSVAAWQDVLDHNDLYQLPVYGYAFNSDPAAAQAYAEAYLSLLNSRMADDIGGAPTVEQTLCAWHRGLSTLQRHHYDPTFDLAYIDLVEANLPATQGTNWQDFVEQPTAPNGLPLPGLKPSGIENPAPTHVAVSHTKRNLVLAIMAAVIVMAIWDFAPGRKPK